MRRRTKNYLGRDFKKKRTSDKLSRTKRSLLMSKIRSKKTMFEEEFIKEMRRELRRTFSVNVNDVKGKPDIVFKRQKVCLFLDSDFWHGWQYPRWKHLLKNDFWREKIERNRNHDRRITNRLRRKGWMVIRIWEHNIKHEKERVFSRIRDAIWKNGALLKSATLQKYRVSPNRTNRMFQKIRKIQ